MTPRPFEHTTDIYIGPEDSRNKIRCKVIGRYYPRLAEGELSPAEPEHIEITGLLKIEGFTCRSIPELLQFINKAELENEILGELS